MLRETIAPTPSRITLGFSTRATLLVEEALTGDAAGGDMAEDARTGADARA